MDNTYDIADIIDRIEDELGFVYIKTSEDHGYINLGQGNRLTFNFAEGNPPKMFLEFTSRRLNVTENMQLLELYSTIIESVAQIYDIVMLMTEGEVEDEDTD